MSHFHSTHEKLTRSYRLHPFRVDRSRQRAVGVDHRHQLYHYIRRYGFDGFDLGIDRMYVPEAPLSGTQDNIEGEEQKDKVAVERELGSVSF